MENGYMENESREGWMAYASVGASTATHARKRQGKWAISCSHAPPPSLTSSICTPISSIPSCERARIHVHESRAHGCMSRGHAGAEGKKAGGTAGRGRGCSIQAGRQAGPMRGTATLQAGYRPATCHATHQQGGRCNTKPRAAYGTHQQVVNDNISNPAGRLQAGCLSHNPPAGMQ